MQIHQIRSATIIITYNNKKFLVDPWFGPKDYMEGFDSAYNSEIRQPRIELPISIDKIVNVDVVILTHFHPDHWDKYASDAINKDIPFFVQNETDKNIIKSEGFSNVRIIPKDGIDFEGVQLFKTPTQHGNRETVKSLCESIGMPYDAMGVVFKSDNEKTLYLAGDTIWCDEVKTSIDKYAPEIIIVNACGARILNGEYLIMNLEDLKDISAYAKNSKIIASHLDTVSHLTVTRKDIATLNLANVLVPQNNETVYFK